MAKANRVEAIPPETTNVEQFRVPPGKIATANTVGKRLQVRREELGLKQAEVAEQMGLSRTAYCQYETGSSSMTTQKVERAARVLHTRPEWIAFGIGERNAVEVIAFNGDEFDRVAVWSLGEDWLQQRFGLGTHETKLARVDAPVNDLHAGDMAVVHAGAAPSAAVSDFLFVIDGEMSIAPVTRLAKGSQFRIFGPNKTHQDVPAEDVHIAGKVVGRLGGL